MYTTKSDPTRTFIEIKAGKPIAECPGIAFWDRKRENSKLRKEGAVGQVAEGIINILMNDLKEGEEPVIEKITIHPDGVWLLISKGIETPLDKIIGFAEGILAHATLAKQT